MNKEQFEKSFAGFHPDAPAYLKKQSEALCPRCHHKILGYPALSRSDNKTDVCSDCGVWEAMCQWSNNGKLPAIKDGRDLNKLVMLL